MTPAERIIEECYYDFINGKKQVVTVKGAITQAVHLTLRFCHHYQKSGNIIGDLYIETKYPKEPKTTYDLSQILQNWEECISGDDKKQNAYRNVKLLFTGIISEIEELKNLNNPQKT
jgi:hypothetical protein